MDWQRGLKRLRLVGTVSLLLGVISFGSVYLTNTLGYAPDALLKPFFPFVGELGLLLTIFGCMVSVATWVIQGFAPLTPPTRIDTVPARRARPED
jgi:hypothetical protein